MKNLFLELNTDLSVLNVLNSQIILLNNILLFTMHKQVLNFHGEIMKNLYLDLNTDLSVLTS
jgi:hypothetical protein